MDNGIVYGRYVTGNDRAAATGRLRLNNPRLS
jgi:hypothetical protein